MKPVVFLICGVPGSGKTWVCEQLDGKGYAYVPHDDFIKDEPGYLEAIKDIATTKPVVPVLTDCPFGERVARDLLEGEGYDVKPVFIIEPTAVVQERYLKREGKPLSAASVTRSVSIRNRAEEWGAPSGTAAEVLEMLKKGRGGKHVQSNNAA